MRKETKIKFIELFAGIGGFRYGLEKANYSSQYATKKSESPKSTIQQGRKWTSNKRKWNKLSIRYRELSGNRNYKCIWANEWDKYAAKIYEKNFGEKPDTRDIRTVEANEIPNHDLLTAGFPCQAFSIAGHRKGFKDTRGTLFFDIARILNTKRPRYLLLENVRGLLSHDKGRTFKIILSTLDELGYDLQWQVLNSKNFGVPQNRERVFVVGHIRGTSRPKVFPIRTCNKDINEKYKKEISQSENTQTITATYYKGGKGSHIKTIMNINQAQSVYDIEGISVAIQALAGGQGAKTGLYQIDKMKIRRLTPVECERLQGFPDGWTEGVSDTQRYKCLGNAVTTNVITEIGRRL